MNRPGPMIAMTGATGFLGSRLLPALLAAGYRVAILKRSSSNTARIAGCIGRVRSLDLDREDPEPLFAEEPVEAVIHCATDYGRRNVEPYRIVEANIVLPLRLLHLARRHGVRCFVNTDTVLDKRISHYSLSKSQFLQWLRLHSDQLVCGNVALEHFYGPGDDETKFVPYVIHSLLKRVPWIDLTPGEQTRYFIHVSDVVEAFLRILEHLRGHAPGFRHFEVGAPDAIAIRDFVQLAAKICGNHVTELRFGALPYRPDEIMHPALDLQALRALGWEPRMSVAAGLADSFAGERQRLARAAGGPDA